MEENFDNIRPYNSEEFLAAMQRIAANPLVEQAAPYVFPDKEVDEVRHIIQSCRTVEQFQIRVMKTFVEQIMCHSIDNLVVTGIEHLQDDVNYIFVSNHRDITLDALLQNYVLYCHRKRVCYVTFGANLMSDQTIIDLGLSNRMFRIERNGQPKQFYEHLQHASSYIYHILKTTKHSVWIAQSNGRTKNGLDATNPTLIKMFSLGPLLHGDEGRATVYNIVPVAISYEWEPCDWQKARELAYTLRAPYVKQEGEDKASILSGIITPKGNVHIHFGIPIRHSWNDSKCTKMLAQRIDEQIFDGYCNMENNYIAADLRAHSNQYQQYYSCQQQESFLQRVANLPQLSSEKDADILADMRRIFIDIYANSVRR